MLWAITSFFDPVGYKRRLQNYRAFRSRLNIPLVTVELACGNDFELEDDDAEILIQIRCPDVLWQKERLLNIALDAVPRDVEKFAWIDCDIVFESDSWAPRAEALLDEFPLLQLFEKVHHVDAGAHVDRLGDATIVNTQYSLIYALANGLVAPKIVAGRFGTGPDVGDGYAWAARRGIFATTGFYDTCVVGGGDRAMLAAAVGKVDEGIRYLTMSSAHAAHFREWARCHAETIHGKPGFLQETICHLWHGDLAHRQYAERHKGLLLHQFDPDNDIRIDANGCWRWNSEKPGLHEFVKQYFRSRNEDGRRDAGR